MYTILSTLQTHKIGKFDVSKAISMMLVMREMDKVKTHLDAYCISSISFASKRDKHFYTWFFVLKSFQHLNDCIWLPFSTIWNTLNTFWYKSGLFAGILNDVNVQYIDMLYLIVYCRCKSNEGIKNQRNKYFLIII